MDVGRSIRIAMAQRNVNQTWLAKEMGGFQSHISNMVSRKTANSAMIEKLAKAFDLSASEFIALGETED